MEEARRDQSKQTAQIYRDIEKLQQGFDRKLNIDSLRETINGKVDQS
jgi:hypothetical protein